MPREIFGIKVYSVSEVAKELGKSPSTIRRYIYDNKLGAIQIGRELLIPEGELRKFIVRNSTKKDIEF
ncbi:helix-turn-helix domain-containing protein [Thermovibrio sp.]